MADVVQELLPYRLIETKLVTELGQSLGCYAALASSHLDRIARYQPDRNKGDEHQREECRQRQRNAAGEVLQHRSGSSSGSQRSGSGPLHILCTVAKTTYFR